MLLIIHPHSAKTCMCFSLLWNTKENIFGMLFGLKNHFFVFYRRQKEQVWSDIRVVTEFLFLGQHFL